MQKIIIKNFGAIQNAEIEVKKILVLIGEQASGKSTIAKLIYFFKTLKDDLFSQIYQDTQKDYFDTPSDLIFPIRDKFYNFFGSTFHLPDFEITFYYSVEQDKYLTLTLNENKRLNSRFSDNLLNENFKSSATQIKKLFQQNINPNNIHEQLAYDQNKIKYAKMLSTLLNEFFESYQTDSLFVIAGRNATVSYSDFFEKNLFASVQRTLEENSKIKENSKKFQRKQQTIDETLMLKFMERVGRIKDIFKKFKDFIGIIENYEDDIDRKEDLYLIKNRIDNILKGKYLIDDWGEKILFKPEQRKYVYLSNASSGQQEVIRILQDIFLNILDDVKVLRIIEEPEAHLFPVAQKQLIELLALMVNHDEDNQLIITTHSPYILTVFNNLLFANRVVDKNTAADAEVTAIIPKDCWLNAHDFSAYSLGNQSVSETTNYCESIFNTEKGTIQQNYLDTVSELLGGDFQALYSIHARTFKRK
ncbi:AAA family ATPase [Anabaena catenula]|uniref:ATP-binding protein n=1 Tax=Anabaena catenula FACHB-362 TaxID=2692877 RepID=A0ABR8J2N4_9NOST|nr:AAA family ATPase [Anabaena catenula]MBD2691411.1 ATP-binding protein [Anabaena catenula FACHB-362]